MMIVRKEALAIMLINLCSLIGCAGASATDLTVMTFNTWLSGEEVEDGFEKIVKHIRRINPDIVALQEVQSTEFLLKLTKYMGGEWESVTTSFDYPDDAILTRHKIFSKSVSQVSHGIGARIRLENLNKTVHFWCLHLDYRSYGPYAAFNKLVTNYGQILAGEMSEGQGRFQNLRELLLDQGFQRSVKKSDKEPLIVAGDFNAPSHLDWQIPNRHLHGDWYFDWPSTKMLQEEALMIDSYRQLHPNVTKNPGYTWSTVEKMSSAGWDFKIPEPQDRIDFIFYRSALLQPIHSYIYQGNETVTPKPHHRFNDYPSDHFAVITKFVVQ